MYALHPKGLAESLALRGGVWYMLWQDEGQWHAVLLLSCSLANLGVVGEC